MSIQPNEEYSKKETQQRTQEQTKKEHSAKLQLLDKNGDGLLDEHEQPWDNEPEGYCSWAKTIFTFSWLAKFQKSPIVGNAAEQSAAIKETLNTVGLVTALIATITIPIAMNPSDVNFETKDILWGANIRMFNEQWTIVLFYTGIYISIVCHIVSLGGVVISLMSLSCLSDDILTAYIEQVGSNILLVPIAMFIIGVIFAVLSAFVIGLYTLGLYWTLGWFFILLALVFGVLFPLLYKVVKPLYYVPGQAIKGIKKQHDEMTKVTVENVITWLEEITNVKGKNFFSTDFKIETVVEVFKKEGISGMALPAVNAKFLRKQCGLNWGDAYLLMKVIELRKGHVIHWRSD